MQLYVIRLTFCETYLDRRGIVNLYMMICIWRNVHNAKLLCEVKLWLLMPIHDY